MRYRREIQCAAAEVIDLLNEKANGKNWTAIHVRRGDFQFTEAKVDEDEGHRRRRCEAGFFDICRDGRAETRLLHRSREIATGISRDGAREVRKTPGSPPSRDPNWAGMVEQHICRAASVFLGTWWSTFTGYITRIRGYRG